MNRMVLLAIVSILGGLLVGAAVIVGVTRAEEAGSEARVIRDPGERSVFTEVSYGDRCFHGHCLPPEIPRCIHGHCLP